MMSATASPRMTADQAMAAYASGDSRAFEIVYDEVAQRLNNYLRRHLSQTSAEDVVQQTFLQMHGARGTFIAGARVVPWAFQIAKRIVIDSQRKNRREESFDFWSDGGWSDEPGLATTAASPVQLVEARETCQVLVAAYERLTPEQRDAVDLRDAGLSCQQAALALHTSPVGLRVRIYRALTSLRGAVRAATTDRGPEGPTPAARGARSRTRGGLRREKGSIG